MSYERKSYAWAGTFREFCNAPVSSIEDALQDHLLGLMLLNASSTQKDAWIEQIEILKSSFRDLAIARPDSLDWGLVLEYELPLEGGRRPDVVITAPNKIMVLEFKQDPRISGAYLDQAHAYARDLAEYHSKSHESEVEAYLVSTKSRDLATKRDAVTLLSPNMISAILDNSDSTPPIDIHDWLTGDYLPLPSLIEAARMIFKNERLPAIKRAESLGVGQAVLQLQKISNWAEENNSRTLAFVAGVPGAGKTLVGLRYVYEASGESANSIFLSGNGPLVEVLRDALKARAFVRDLHSFIKSYGTTGKVAKQNIIVFDEAQRAWDAQHMEVKNNIPRSEPELLIQIGEQVPGWSSLVGLIGHGQEINSGEEAGISGWSKALDGSSSDKSWKVFVPPRFADKFPKQEVTVVDSFDLSQSLRSRRAENLHHWVELLLDGDIRSASRLMPRIRAAGFQIHLTRNLDEAREFVWTLYKEDPIKRYGILASSKDRILPKYGILNSFHDTRKVKYAHWYNNPKGEEGSSNNLKEVVTEFGCQGLELDCAIVGWGNDFLFNGSTWEMRKIRSKYTQHDPYSLRKNSYRVLLTRSRDEMVIFVPPDETFDATELALLAAGVKHIELELDIAI